MGVMGTAKESLGSRGGGPLWPRVSLPSLSSHKADEIDFERKSCGLGAKEREEAESRRVRNLTSLSSVVLLIGSLPEVVVGMHVEMSSWVGRRLEKTGGVNPLYVADGPVNF